MKRQIMAVSMIIVALLSVAVWSTNFSERTIMNSIFDGTDAININVSQEAITGNSSIAGTLTVTGATAMNGGITADSTAFTVADTSGNVSTTGTLAVTGISTLTGAVAANGGITVDSTAFTVTDTSGNVATTGTLTVGGASSLKGAVVINEDSADADTRIESNDVSDALVVDAALNTISHGTWTTYDYIETTAQSYSLASTGRASNIIQTVGGAASFHLMTELLTTPGAGAVLTIKTGGTNDVVIDTENAETIDGAATYTLDGSYEAVTLTTNGTNWFVLGGYLE